MAPDLLKPDPAARPRIGEVLVLLAVVLAPRALRLLYPAVNLEDGHLAYLPTLALRGELPYIGFESPYNPAWIVTLLPAYALFGASLLTAEIVTALATTALALLVYAIVRKEKPGYAAVTAAAVLAWHWLFIAYHLFELEIWVSLFVWLGVWILQRASWRLDRRSLVLCAAALGVAFLYKKSALSSGLGVFLFLLVTARRPRAAFPFGGFFAVICLEMTAVLFAAFGNAFLEQTFLFHLVKGADLSPAMRLVAFLREYE